MVKAHGAIRMLVAVATMSLFVTGVLSGDNKATTDRIDQDSGTSIQSTTDFKAGDCQVQSDEQSYQRSG
jgi:hypothetical protein